MLLFDVCFCNEVHIISRYIGEVCAIFSEVLIKHSDAIARWNLHLYGFLVALYVLYSPALWFCSWAIKSEVIIM